MKKLLLILVAILTALGMSACQTHEEQADPIIELDNYDYYLLVVVSRQRLSQDAFIYVLHEAGKPLTSDNITYESEELWSVGEFVIAIELDEEDNVYLTDVYATTDMIVNQYQEQIIDDFELVIELQQHYYQENITSHTFGDWLQINYPALYERLLNYF